MDDICYTHHKGNPESNAANAQTNKSRDRGLILKWMEEHGNATCDELESALELAHQTASARCSELLRDGLIERTGEKRETRTGYNAAVLRIKKEEPPVEVMQTFGERARAREIVLMPPPEIERLEEAMGRVLRRAVATHDVALIEAYQHIYQQRRPTRTDPQGIVHAALRLGLELGREMKYGGRIIA
jgi:DNA-binding HxlR family transcriptional regulator